MVRACLDFRMTHRWPPGKYRELVKILKDPVVCSKHFTRACFEVDPVQAEKFGIEIKASLKPDAVPTVFPSVFP